MVANLWTPNKGLLRDEPNLDFLLRKKCVPSAAEANQQRGKTSDFL